ncbi:MAG TPA: sigma-70 family RNA polymerase sigma factor, partial [Tepidisphaeraceae bacterium]
MKSDLELLREYAQGGSAQSFGLLVRRHVAWVYGASIRQVGGDAHLAEDITQAVFILLSRRAATLPEGTLLTGWLFNTVRYAAAEARRKEARRRKHEANAAIMPQSITPDSEDRAWERLAPLLDETLTLLRESDRQAVLLRYFENKSFEQIADALGINESAARKRVSRAVRKLRALFVSKGVIAPATAVALLTAVLARAASAAPAPANLAEIIAAAACKAGPLPALSLAIVRRTTLRMLRARQRLAVAIISCAGVFFLGLWALLIASMSSTTAPEARELFDTLDAQHGGEPDVVILGQDPIPQVHRPVRGRLRIDRAPAAGDPPPQKLTGDEPPIDRFWHIRPYLDPMNGPGVASRRGANAHEGQQPDRRRPDDDYNEDDDPYGSYAQMGGGGNPVVEGRGGGANPRPGGGVPATAQHAGNVTVASAAHGFGGGSTGGAGSPADNTDSADPKTASSSSGGGGGGSAQANAAQDAYHIDVAHVTRTVVIGGGGGGGGGDSAWDLNLGSGTVHYYIETDRIGRFVHIVTETSGNGSDSDVVRLIPSSDSDQGTSDSTLTPPRASYEYLVNGAVLSSYHPSSGRTFDVVQTVMR